MLGSLCRLVDGRTECKMAGGAVGNPIKDVWGIHLTGVRGVTGGHGSPGEGCCGCLKSWSPANRCATGASSPPDSPASTPAGAWAPAEPRVFFSGGPRRARRRATPVTWIPQKDVMHRQIRRTRPASPLRRIAAAEQSALVPPSPEQKTTNPERRPSSLRTRTGAGRDAAAPLPAAPAHHDRPWTLPCAPAAAVTAAAPAAGRARDAKTVVVVPIAGAVPVARAGTLVLRVVVPRTAAQAHGGRGPVRPPGTAPTRGDLEPAHAAQAAAAPRTARTVAGSARSPFPCRLCSNTSYRQRRGSTSLLRRPRRRPPSSPPIRRAGSPAARGARCA